MAHEFLNLPSASSACVSKEVPVLPINSHVIHLEKQPTLSHSPLLPLMVHLYSFWTNTTLLNLLSLSVFSIINLFVYMLRSFWFVYNSVLTCLEVSIFSLSQIPWQLYNSINSHYIPIPVFQYTVSVVCTRCYKCHFYRKIYCWMLTKTFHIKWGVIILI